MRRDDEILAVEKRVLELVIAREAGARQLILQDIGGVSADPPFLQRLVHVLLVDDAAAAHVQDHRPFLHVGDGLLVEHVPGLLGQRDVDRDEVGDADQFLDAGALGVFRLELLGPQVGIIGYDPHLEGTSQLADAAADLAEAEDAQRFPAELPADELVLVPVVIHLDVVVGGNGVPGDLQHLGDGELGDRVRVHAGRVEDVDALLRGVLHVDVIGPDRADTDHLQLLRGVEDLPVDLGIHAHDQDLIVPDLLQQVCLGERTTVRRVHFDILLQFLRDTGVDGVSDKALHDQFFSFLNTGGYVSMCDTVMYL